MTAVSFHPGWAAYCYSQKGITAIAAYINMAGVSNEGFSDFSTLRATLIKTDPRLSQFLPCGDDSENKFSNEEFTALLELTGMLRGAELNADLLFTGIACMAHGVGRLVSYYSSGTDNSDLENTEVKVLRAGYDKPNTLTVATEEECQAIFDKYNLDPTIFYNELNSDGGAGDGDIYDNLFSVTLLGPEAGTLNNVLLTTHHYSNSQEPEEET